MAFVIVLHLDPTHKGIMPELLQRVTALRVQQVKDRTRIEPGCVYVIPPNKDMSILHGVLHLLDPVAVRGLRLPIDLFFRSLAADREERSIAVILSGMGSDGTLGLKAVKEKAGVAFVQQPESAKFDGMPRSAIDAGLADVVALAEELPGKISAYLRHAPLIEPRSGLAEEDRSRSALAKVLILLRAQTGHDFSLYKRNTVYRRIERRIGLHQIEGIADYVRFLQETPQELDLLFKDLLISVTSFFRDPASWERLEEAITAELTAVRPPKQAVRAWVPGCATGEEAYSLAIVLKEALERIRPASKITIQIFATDLDRAAIDRARAGVFSANIASDVSAERLARYFVPVDRGYQVAKSIRETVIFAVQNVCMDPPFTRLDVLSCRNLLIYLTPELQKKLLPLFHYSLRPGGLLFLGGAESAGAGAGAGHFAALDEKARVYRRLPVTPRTEPVEFPTAFFPAASPPRPLPRAPKGPADFHLLAERLLLDRFAPAAVLVDRKGDIVYVSGRTGQYLEPAAGEANWSIFAMAREGLRYEMMRAFTKALREKGPVSCANLLIESSAGSQAVDLVVEALQEPKDLRGLVVILFKDVVPALRPERSVKPGKRVAGSARVAELERRFEQVRRELQKAREDMQNSLEELKSTNEELQSTNEELQSTNEELTTSREEMQSMNEELQTLNHELQAKMDHLSRTNSDIRNLLEGIENPVLFLDGVLRLRLFTAAATRVFRLIPGDVGRPITDIANDLVLPDLEDRVQQVLRTLAWYEQDVVTQDGRWMALRILPYRTIDNLIDGTVITLTDITTAKTLEAELRRVQAGLQQRVEAQARELDQGRGVGRGE
jgi:chemotaxis methyl-accepting protein methylase/PAS domain-containing protein